MTKCDRCGARWADEPSCGKTVHLDLPTRPGPWRVRVDQDGPVLWLFCGDGCPREAFQPAWSDPRATWSDVLDVLIREGVN